MLESIIMEENLPIFQEEVREIPLATSAEKSATSDRKVPRAELEK
jgi:hypothetical protein